MFHYLKSLIKLFFITDEHFLRKKGVKIGKNCSIMSRNFGSEPYLVEIGDHVQITNGVKIFTHGAGWVLRLEYPDFDTFGKVKIGNNVYIGNNVLIMPGVTIGNNVVIGAGSVITKSIEDNTVVAGNPAKPIGKIDDFKAQMLMHNFRTKGLGYKQKRKVLLSSEESLFIKK
jgi:acetyltransferase-like isoleucine patch superfamily enzyme